MTTLNVTVSVVNGSNAVDLVEGFVDGNIEVGDLLVLAAAPTVAWQVGGLGTADSPPSPQRFYLTANFAGDSDAEAAGQVTRDFTINYALPLMNPFDVGPWAVQAEAQLRIDAALAGLADDFGNFDDEDHGDRGGGTLHEVATGEAAGFMSAAHVTALAALATALDGHDIESGVWTPTFSFSTPGDLSVDYHVQEGTFLRIGNDVFLTAYLEFTPTHTTASAGARLADVPFVIDADSLGDLSFTTNGGSTMPAYPSGVTELMLLVSASAEALVFGGRGSSTASNVGATQLTSGVRRSVRANCFYKADLTP
jgi:hypothetical protein